MWTQQVGLKLDSIAHKLVHNRKKETFKIYFMEFLKILLVGLQIIVTCAGEQQYKNRHFLIYNSNKTCFITLEMTN